MDDRLISKPGPMEIESARFATPTACTGSAPGESRSIELWPAGPSYVRTVPSIINPSSHATHHTSHDRLCVAHGHPSVSSKTFLPSLLPPLIKGRGSDRRHILTST